MRLWRSAVIVQGAAHETGRSVFVSSLVDICMYTYHMQPRQSHALREEYQQQTATLRWPGMLFYCNRPGEKKVPLIADDIPP